MVEQTIYLLDWDWICRVYYETGPEDCDRVLHDLHRLGCRSWNYSRARRNLSEGRLNTGLTYSNYEERESVMCLGRSTSAEEFSNTYDHEKNHLAKHICRALGIDPFGEEASYVSGAINQQMFRTAKHFMCEHCRRTSEKEEGGF